MGTWGHDKVLLAGWLHIQTHTMHIGMRTPTQALCSILWPRAACMHADIYRGPVQHARMRTPSEAPCSMYACGHLPRPRAARMHADTYRGPVQQPGVTRAGQADDTQQVIHGRGGWWRGRGAQGGCRGGVVHVGRHQRLVKRVEVTRGAPRGTAARAAGRAGGSGRGGVTGGGGGCGRAAGGGGGGAWWGGVPRGGQAVVRGWHSRGAR